MEKPKVIDAVNKILSEAKKKYPEVEEVNKVIEYWNNHKDVPSLIRYLDENNAKLCGQYVSVTKCFRDVKQEVTKARQNRKSDELI